jgi:hypothetical protein
LRRRRSPSFIVFVGVVADEVGEVERSAGGAIRILRRAESAIAIDTPARDQHDNY